MKFKANITDISTLPDITAELKANQELNGLINSKFEGDDWVAWINKDRGEISVATNGRGSDKKTFRRDFKYSGEMPVEQVVENFIIPVFKEF